MSPFPLRRSLALALLVLAGPAARAGDDCDAPPASWQPRSAVHALAQRQGWRIQSLKVDDGCYEIKGRDTEGLRFKAKVDPATLRVIRLQRAHSEPDRQRAGVPQGPSQPHFPQE